MSWFEALVLAVVQGLSEFLPISSDGHLSVVRSLVRAWEGGTGPKLGGLFYIVLLHVGTLASIALYYRRQAREGARGLLGEEVREGFRRSEVVKAGILAGLATLPAVPVGLFLKEQVEALFDSPTAASIGFLITAAELALVAGLPEGKKTLRETTWWHALLIGCAQAFAILPGVSRSGSTIALALALGFKRSWAVGFSLLIAVPAILGATVLEVKDLDPELLAGGLLAKVAVGVVVAAVVGYGAIAWLARVVARGRLWYFSVYLCLLAAAVYAGLVKSEPEPAGGGDGQAVESREGPGGAPGLAGSAGGGLGGAPGG
jgi:undecaprenyl-diphosphatase